MPMSDLINWAELIPADHGMVGDPGRQCPNEMSFWLALI
jgi:hypothetical protein